MNGEREKKIGLFQFRLSTVGGFHGYNELRVFFYLWFFLPVHVAAHNCRH